jgi:hypothetical protein
VLRRLCRDRGPRSPGRVRGMTWVIRYHSRSTVNGEPVGIVYALDIGHLAPGAWSYKKEPAEATQFDSRHEAESIIQQIGHWPEAEAVES